MAKIHIHSAFRTSNFELYILPHFALCTLNYTFLVVCRICKISIIHIICSGLCPCVLTGLTLSGKTVYAAGDPLQLTATAQYDRDFARDVSAAAVFSGFDPARPGRQTVTAVYRENGVERAAEITVSVQAAASLRP